MSENNKNSMSASEAGRIAATGFGGRRIRVLAYGGQGARCLVQDARYLYWSDRGDDTVTRLSKDGGVPFILATGQRWIRELTLADGWLYWATRDSVLRTPAAGGDIEIIAEGQEGAQSVAVRGAEVVWTTFGDGLDTGEVKRTTLGSGRVMTIAQQQKQPAALVVDAQNIYWANHGIKRPDYFKDGSIAFAPWAAGAAPVVVATDQRLASSTAVDDAWIYWMTGTSYDPPHRRGALRKRRKDGGAVVELASWDWYESGALALDETHAYWLQAIHAGIFRVKKTGGDPEQIMAGNPDEDGVFPDSLLVDDRCVYWTARDSRKAGGAVFKTAK